MHLGQYLHLHPHRKKYTEYGILRLRQLARIQINMQLVIICPRFLKITEITLRGRQDDPSFYSVTEEEFVMRYYGNLL